MTPLKLITFDVTGTMLVLRESVGNQYSKIGLRYGITAPPEILSKNFYTSFKSLLTEHPNFGEKSGVGWQEWWRKLVTRVFQDSLPEAHLSSVTIDKISADLIEVYKTKECWELAKGAKELLEELKQKNLRLGVISNYDPRLHNILQDLQIYDYFNFVLTSYEARCQKPDNAIFQTVQKMNTDVVIKEILHIGDNPQFDFMGATNAGWNAILICDNVANVTKQFPLIESKWIVKCIYEISDCLKREKLIQ